MNTQDALRELKALEGRAVELRFKDGHIVRALLIDVDPGSAPNDLIYDILEVLDWGPINPSAFTDEKASVAANAAELDSWKLVG